MCIGKCSEYTVFKKYMKHSWNLILISAPIDRKPLHIFMYAFRIYHNLLHWKITLNVFIASIWWLLHYKIVVTCRMFCGFFYMEEMPCISYTSPSFEVYTDIYMDANCGLETVKSKTWSVVAKAAYKRDVVNRRLYTGLLVGDDREKDWNKKIYAVIRKHAFG